MVTTRCRRILGTAAVPMTNGTTSGTLSESSAVKQLNGCLTV